MSEETLNEIDTGLEQAELALLLEHQAAELDGDSMLAKVEQEQEQAEQEQAAQDEAELAQMLTMAIHGTAAIMAPNWEITADESAGLAGVYAPLITKYCPNAGQYMGIELQAAMVTAGVIGARLMAGTPRKKPKEAKADETEPTGTVEKEVLQEDAVYVAG